MDTGIWIIRQKDNGGFYMNTNYENKFYMKPVTLPYSVGDSLVTGFTFTTDEKEDFIKRIVASKIVWESDLQINQVYFNKNNTMIILPNIGE